LLRLAGTVLPECWETLRPLAQATTEAAHDGDRAAYAEADRAFHGALLALGGNAQLVSVADELHRRAQWPSRGGAEPHRGRLLADAADHAVLLDALAGGDLATVEELVRGHFAAAPGA